MGEAPMNQHVSPPAVIPLPGIDVPGAQVDAINCMIEDSTRCTRMYVG
jgi:hypothetical protein